MRKSGAFRKSNKTKIFKAIILCSLAGLMVIHFSTAFASEGSEGGGGGITVIPDVSVFIQMANFIFLIWILNILLYRPIRNILTQRKEKISGLEQDIDTAETEALEQDEAFAKGVKEARTKGFKEKEALLQRALEEEKEIIGKINEKAQAELVSVRKQIAKDTQAVKESLLKEVDGFATTISEKILGRAF